MKTTFKIIVIGFLSGLAGSYAGYQYWVYPAAVQPVPMADFQSVNFTNAEDVALPVPAEVALPPAVSEDFSVAASRSTASVVYINSISQGVSYSNWDWFFGETPGRQEQVSSGSGVIFTADDDGHLIAVDAKEGKHLWHYQMGEPLNASPIIYSVDGKEYVAVAASTAIFSFGLFEPVKSIPVPVTKIQ